MAVTKLRSLRCLYMNNNRLTKLHPRYRKIQCYPYYLQHALNFILSLKEMVSLGYIWLRGNKLQSLPVELCTVRRVFKMTKIRLSSSQFQFYWLKVPSRGHHFENFFDEKYQSDSFRIQRNWICFWFYWSLTQPQTTLSNRVQNNRKYEFVHPSTYGSFYRSLFIDLKKTHEAVRVLDTTYIDNG